MSTFKQIYLEEELFPELNKKYPRAGAKVDGRKVLKNVDNTDSISATFNEWEELKGIRALKMKDFGGPNTVFYAKDDFDRARDLAERIKISNEISPLIVVIDDEGPYILEGAHRFVALHNLKAKSFPALVIVDTEEYEGN